MTATDFTAAPLLDVPPAGQATPAPVRSPVVRADAEQWDMRSTITGRTYRIYVAKPDATVSYKGAEVVVK